MESRPLVQEYELGICSGYSRFPCGLEQASQGVLPGLDLPLCGRKQLKRTIFLSFQSRPFCPAPGTRADYICPRDMNFLLSEMVADRQGWDGS